MHAPNDTIEREGNGNNPLMGSPWWVRAAWVLGVPSLIALGLTYYVTIGADAKLTRIDQVVVASESGAVKHDEQVRKSFDRLEGKQDETTRILLALCVNGAKDEAARNRCVGR